MVRENIDFEIDFGLLNDILNEKILVLILSILRIKYLRRF